MNYDKVLEEIGELGRWQLVSLSLLALLAASNGVDNTFNVFTGNENIATKSIFTAVRRSLLLTTHFCLCCS